MPFVVVAYHENQDEAGAYAAEAAVSDPIVTQSGDYIYIPKWNHLIGAFAALGTTGVGAYLDSPSLRRLQYYNIFPIEQLLIGGNPPAIKLHPESPFRLDQDEGMRAFANANPAAVERHTVGVWLSDGAISPIRGEIIKARATAAITEAAGAWVEGELTFVQSLPSGRYQVVGGRCECSANGVLFRFVPIGVSERAGGLCANVADGLEYPMFRDGNLGVWCEFEHRTPPSIEVLASAAGGTAQTVILDLIKIG